MLGAHAWRPSPSPQPPSAPLRGEGGGGRCLPFPLAPLQLLHGGRTRKNAGNCSRNGCVLGARTSGPHLDGWNRGHRLQRRYCGARLAALTFPPAPFRSPTGRGRGRALPPLPPASFRSSIGGGRERTPEIAHAMVACWKRGPLARILMDGTGGTGCSAGAGSARLAALPFPLAPFRSSTGLGRGRALPPLPPGPFTASLVARRARSHPYHTLTT